MLGVCARVCVHVCAWAHAGPRVRSPLTTRCKVSLVGASSAEAETSPWQKWRGAALIISDGSCRCFNDSNKTHSGKQSVLTGSQCHGTAHGALLPLLGDPWPVGPRASHSFLITLIQRRLSLGHGVAWSRGAWVLSPSSSHICVF